MIKNLDKINIIKRDKVYKGITFVENINTITPTIDKIIVFGSAITDTCDDESDIDICFVSRYPVNDKRFLTVYGKFPIIAEDNCDIFEINNINKKLRHEIETKGIIVYEYSISLTS